MIVLFRTDASLEIGTGHVMRCLTLADALRERGAICRFVCRAHPGNLIELIQQRGYEVITLAYTANASAKLSSDGASLPAHVHWLGTDWETDARETCIGLEGKSVDWLIVDHYALDARWERNLRPVCQRLMVIDDLADRPHDCDVLLDQNWFANQTEHRYDALVPSKCLKLLGPQYVLLKPEYVQLRRWIPPRDGIVRRIMVFMGGSDPTNQTAKALQALMAPDLAFLAVDVVIGVNHPDPSSIQKLVIARPATTLHQNLPSLAGLMVRADLMIGAGGSTTWERMSLGLPCIVISIAANQTSTNQALMTAGYIHFLGEMENVSVNDIAQALRGCFRNPNILAHQIKLMKILVDANGTDCLTNILFSSSETNA